MLDNPARCISELSEINADVASFGADWAIAAGALKGKTLEFERRHRAALRGLHGEDLKVAEKDAAAHAAVEISAPGLAEEIERLETQVEQFKVHFRSLERRSSNVQSILSAYRAEARQGEFVTAEPEWSGRTE